MKYWIWGLILGFVLDIILWGSLAWIPGELLMFVGYLGILPISLIVFPIVGLFIGIKLDRR